MMVTSLPELMRYSAGEYQMMAELVTALGFIGLALTIVGLYGYLAFRVTQRRREIGIRMALGASREATSLLVFRDTAGMALIGLALGVVLAVGGGAFGVVAGVWREPVGCAFDCGRAWNSCFCRCGGKLAARPPRRFHRSHAGFAHRVTTEKDDEFAASGRSLRTAPVAQVARVHHHCGA